MIELVDIFKDQVNKIEEWLNNDGYFADTDEKKIAYEIQKEFWIRIDDLENETATNIN